MHSNSNANAYLTTEEMTVEEYRNRYSQKKTNDVKVIEKHLSKRLTELECKTD